MLVLITNNAEIQCYQEFRVISSMFCRAVFHLVAYLTSFPHLCEPPNQGISISMSLSYYGIHFTAQPSTVK